MWVWWVFDELHRAWLGNGIFWVCQQRGRPLFIDPLLDSVRGGGLVALLRCATDLDGILASTCDPAREHEGFARPAPDSCWLRGLRQPGRPGWRLEVAESM